MVSLQQPAFRLAFVLAKAEWEIDMVDMEIAQKVNINRKLMAWQASILTDRWTDCQNINMQLKFDRNVNEVRQGDF